ncbi:SPOR domain-containing protein [Pseudidiomarina sediminum]|uniref:SPOR domain-containing protein n=1 Tax=Pseudidiomarina sediminum TaxID=431675 RepID=A0A432Z8U6_9GAMM|nr:SPOR domain-containing protein [Pseudidiomarina sediminum]RUO74333.1 SPOR domain-containing protein [Pseudidiomarina sediminum]
MASQLQNRIVGSIILIALAVIILPELFDGQQVREQEQFAAMPIQPDADVVEKTVVLPTEDLGGTPIDLAPPKPLPDTVELTSDDAPQVSQAAETSSETPANKPAEPVTSDLSQPGYVVQLGAFSNAESVNALIRELKAKNFAAYSEKVQVNGKTLIRLLVGPALTEAELEQQLPELKKLTGLEGRVVRFEP